MSRRSLCSAHDPSSVPVVFSHALENTPRAPQARTGCFREQQRRYSVRALFSSLVVEHGKRLGRAVVELVALRHVVERVKGHAEVVRARHQLVERHHYLC